ncbi:hypothetical protein [Luteolibacter sp. LG18]|uniref:hypothetical protein n=1 Tax=Luteolibacter sp. LG18 TaxID=2819286 RepID=UPI002B2D4E61|nr:hypothetical protein llg_09420 [Luteolibacter sp. LG18]
MWTVILVAIGSAALCNYTGWRYSTVAYPVGPYAVLIWWGALLLAPLMMMRGWDLQLRHDHLPEHGRVPWCFRVVTGVVVISIVLVALLEKVGDRLPWVYRSHNHDIIRWFPDGPTGRDYSSPRTAGFSEELTPTWSRGINWNGFNTQHEPVALRFYPTGAPSASGWIIHAGNTVIRRESDGYAVPWTGKGVVEVLSDISGTSFPPDQQGRLASEFDTVCATWSSGHSFTRGSHNGSRPPAWLAWAVSGVVCLLISAGVYVSAKATMGEAPGETADPG